MKTRITLLSLALTAACAPALAQNPNPVQTGALPVPANRIVGLWQVDVTTAPCAGGPAVTFSALGNFHAGGTLTDFNTFSPATRSTGMGIWRYQGRDRHGTGRYKTRFQFFRHVNGVFDGVQDISTTIRLAPNGNSLVMDVRALVLNLDGSVRAELCGAALGERVTFAP